MYYEGESIVQAGERERGKENQHEHVRTGGPTRKLVPYFHSERTTILTATISRPKQVFEIHPLFQNYKITENYTQESYPNKACEDL
jgi:hypothetical protein